MDITLKDKEAVTDCFYGLEDLMNIRPASTVNGDGHHPTDALKMQDRRTGADAEKWFGPGIRSLADLQRVAKEGWTDGLRRINDAVGAVGGDIVPVSLKRKIVRGDAGDNYDIHRANCGGLDRAWDSRKRQMRVAGGAQMTIAVAIGQYGGDDAMELFWRGAAAVRLADLFTTAGYQVQVVAYVASHNMYDGPIRTSLSLVEVKPASAPLDMTALATVVALSGVRRHYGLWQHHAHENPVADGHGTPISRAELTGADINITSYVDSKRACEQFIQKAVKDHGMEQAA